MYRTAAADRLRRCHMLWKHGLFLGRSSTASHDCMDSLSTGAFRRLAVYRAEGCFKRSSTLADRAESNIGRQAGRAAGMSTAAEGNSSSSRFSVPWPWVGLAGAFAAGATVSIGTVAIKNERKSASGEQSGGHFTNWSETHEVSPKRLYEPETTQELERIVAQAHQKGERLRCVGSALSPNGIAFSEEGMVSLALLDKVLEVDKVTGRVKVQAGARVQEVVEALRPHGLTLQNYASIREQSIGGFTQVSAHGTGARIPTVDEQVVDLKLVTPGRGTIELSDSKDPQLFRLAKVGLGLLGVASEITLQCVPAHSLLEHTFVATAKTAAVDRGPSAESRGWDPVQEVRRKHKQWLEGNQHIKYLWIPYTDAVVVVTNNPVPEGTEPPLERSAKFSEPEKLEPFKNLLSEALGERTPADIEELSGPQLRDRLLELNALDVNWIKRVNEAEAEFWRKNEGYRVGPSDQQLGFDCGGQQWVLESCFPTGTLRRPSGADLQFMEETLRIIEENQIAAPAPIEQRWSASSRADMSPATFPGDPDVVHSWVGIIMYLPQADTAQRARITDSFNQYASFIERNLLPKYGGVPHWAKLEVDRMGPHAARELLAAKFPLQKFNAARATLDPKNILSNRMLDDALGVTSPC